MYRGLFVWLPMVPKLALVAVKVGSANSGLLVRFERFGAELDLQSLFNSELLVRVISMLLVWSTR